MRNISYTVVNPAKVEWTMIGELIRALLNAGIPVAVTSFLLVWWSIKHNHFGAAESIEDIDQEIKRLAKAKSEKKKREKERKKKTAGKGSANAAVEYVVEASNENAMPELNMVHNKWMAFGGGFYGTLALFTYALVELGEIGDFLGNLGNITRIFSSFGIDLIVGFFINSLLNFITAITWPVYWMGEVRSEYIWIWLIAAYGGYYAGTRLAVRRAKNN